MWFDWGKQHGILQKDRRLVVDRLLHFLEIIHVEVAIGPRGSSGDFDSQRLDEEQAAVSVGEDAEEDGRALDFLVEALEHVRTFNVSRVLAQQPL